MQKENAAVAKAGMQTGWISKRGKQALEHHSVRVKYSSETFQRTDLCTAFPITTVYQFLLSFIYPKMILWNN